MKKLFVLMFAMMCSVAYSQSPFFYLGSNVKYWAQQDKSGSNNSGKTITWEFSPEIGYGINKHFQVAAILNFGGKKWEAQNNNRSLQKESTYGVSAYVRYLFGEAAFKPLLGVNVGFLAGSYKKVVHTVSSFPFSNSYSETMTTEEGKLLGYRANIFAGFAYTIHPRWTVIGSFGLLGIEKITKTPDSGTKASITEGGLDIGTLGQRFSVGVYYTL